MFNRKGFTLVELMIVVAIIGILAAIAIPNFVSMQYRAKRAEVPSNVDGIKTAELAYEAAFDTFVAAAQHPGAGSKTQVEWADGSDFDTIGWSPDGKVRGNYSVTSVTNTNFQAVGECDVDGDGESTSYTATKTLNATIQTANNIY